MLREVETKRRKGDNKGMIGTDRNVQGIQDAGNRKRRLRVYGE